MLWYAGSVVLGSLTPARFAFFHTTNSLSISAICRCTSARTPRDLNATVAPFGSLKGSLVQRRVGCHWRARMVPDPERLAKSGLFSAPIAQPDQLADLLALPEFRTHVIHATGEPGRSPGAAHAAREPLV